jgi:hypothetical protein
MAANFTTPGTDPELTWQPKFHHPRGGAALLSGWLAGQ